MVALALRSLLWTVLLPGMVTVFIPWQFFGLTMTGIRFSDPLHVLALVAIVAGAAVLLLCVWEFAHSGRGTLAPIDAPRALVVQGLYRYVRNPMYAGVLTILLGELLLIRTTPFMIYGAVWFAAVNAFIIGYEEPALRRRFGASYDEYSSRVRRWVPRLPVIS